MIRVRAEAAKSINSAADADCRFLRIVSREFQPQAGIPGDCFILWKGVIFRLNI